VTTIRYGNNKGGTEKGVLRCPGSPRWFLSDIRKKMTFDLHFHSLNSMTRNSKVVGQNQRLVVLRNKIVHLMLESCIGRNTQVGSPVWVLPGNGGLPKGFASLGRVSLILKPVDE
jgi:hypothetical protein